MTPEEMAEKLVEGAISEVIERVMFSEHLQRCSEIVAKWPKWKRDLLGRTCPLHGDGIGRTNRVNDD